MSSWSHSFRLGDPSICRSSNVEPAADRHEGVVAGGGDPLLHIEQLAVQVDHLDLQAGDAALGVAPVDVGVGGVPQLAQQAGAHVGPPVVGDADVELVGAQTGLGFLDLALARPARRVDRAEVGVLGTGCAAAFRATPVGALTATRVAAATSPIDDPLAPQLAATSSSETIASSNVERAVRFDLVARLMCPPRTNSAGDLRHRQCSSTERRAQDSTLSGHHSHRSRPVKSPSSPR
jgi:hypothetical protein